MSLEAPRHFEVEVLGNDEQWADAVATLVTDDNGAADDAGLDLATSRLGSSVPAGYAFTASDDWREIPGTRNVPSGWSTSDTFDVAVDVGHRNRRVHHNRCAVFDRWHTAGIRRAGPVGREPWRACLATADGWVVDPMPTGSQIDW